MKTQTFKTYYQKQLSDILTPVSIYLRLRDRFPESILLESSDYHSNQNSFSYICFNPLITFESHHGTQTISYKNKITQRSIVDASYDLTDELHTFIQSFNEDPNVDLPFFSNGVFGYTSYDCVQHFHNIKINQQSSATDVTIPDVVYRFYQNIIAIDHFRNEAHLLFHTLENEAHNLDEITQILKGPSYNTFQYQNIGTVSSNLSDEEFINNVKKAQEHCQRGDVFQMVLSRRFSQAYQGDEFNVYRALRTINPSPYLFYFDYGNFKLFGSSPEAQLIIKNNMAEIHPIAGTYKRTGDDKADAENANELSNDPKENSEHVMLVDLARNDLSQFGTNIHIDKYKEIQYFSHVIHLVSKITAQLKKSENSMRMVAATFPAGTLSGAPKHKAMNLIENIENIPRSFYGGAIGMMDLKGNYNHAILIRTFLAQNHHLYFQAGAGVVLASNPINENQEVYNKLRALQLALQTAENI